MKILYSILLLQMLSLTTASAMNTACTTGEKIAASSDELDGLAISESINAQHEKDLLLKIKEAVKIKDPNTEVVIEKIESILSPSDNLHTVKIYGKAPGETESRLLASFEAEVKNGEISLLSQVEVEAKGLGIQNAVYKKLAQMHPGVKKWKDDFIMDNKRIFGLELEKQLEGLPGYKKVDFNNFNDTFENKMGQCCSEALEKLSPQKRSEMYQAAVKKTPDYKSISNAGFKNFCGSGLTVHFNKSPKGSHFMKVSIEMCR